jgi:hypothetical protein
MTRLARRRPMVRALAAVAFFVLGGMTAGVLSSHSQARHAAKAAVPGAPKATSLH